MNSPAQRTSQRKKYASLCANDLSALRTQCVDRPIVSANVSSRLPDTAVCFVWPHALRAARALAMRTNTPAASAGFGDDEPRSSFSSNLTVNTSPLARALPPVRDFFFRPLPADADIRCARWRSSRARAHARTMTTFADAAYCKALLHAHRHPAADVCGVLLGNSNGAGGGGGGAGGRGGAAAHVVDVVPLFHTVMLAPMFEMAMLQIDAYCKIKCVRLCPAGGRRRSIG